MNGMERAAQQRQLAEIQRRLAADEPGLVRVLATGRLSASGRAVVALGSGLVAVAAGLALAMLGFQLASPVLLVAGGVVFLAFPASLALSRIRRRRRRRPSRASFRSHR